MTNKKIIIGIIIAVIVIIGVVVLVGGNQSVSTVLGGVTNYDSIEAGSMAIGTGCTNEGDTCTGTTISQMNGGVCYIKAYAATIVASSTATVDCQATALVSANGLAPLTGVLLDDAVQVLMSTTTAGTTFMGLDIIGAAGSSTPGYLTLRVRNLTGTTFTWPTTGNATGTVYYRTSR